MIEKLQVQPITPDGCYSGNDLLIENKINELVAFANSSEKSTKEQINESIKKHCSTCRAFDRCSWDGKYTGTTHCKDWIEPITEKMYTLDEVASMVYGLFGDPPCDFNDMDEKCDEFCDKQCYLGGDYTEEELAEHQRNCWKHAIQSGWLKGE